MRRNCERGDELMTKNEQELINIIRASEDPEKAMVTAIQIICHYLELHELSPTPPAADPPVSA